MSFECEKCGKFFTQKNNLSRHLKKRAPCHSENEHIIYSCSLCGKEYNNKNSLYKHMNKQKKCNENNTACKYNGEYDSDEESTTAQSLILHPIQNNHNADNKLSDDQDKKIMKILLSRLLKKEENSDLVEELKAEGFDDSIIKNIMNHSHNTNSNNTSNIENSNNTLNNTTNTYLLNYVVKNYPNAKNIEDCMNVKKITPKLLKDCYDMYFIEGSMHIIKEMCDIGEEHRPFHCTDASRGNYIYKTKDVWRIDVGGEEIKSHIIPVINNTYKQVHNNRITNNPNSDKAKANMCLEMTSDNVKKICGKALRKINSSFIAKNNKSSKLTQMQKIKIAE
jgi:uncharacterized C2H2 Zn-finger protein